MQNEEERKQVGENLHERVKENFTWKVMAKKIADEIKYV